MGLNEVTGLKSLGYTLIVLLAASSAPISFEIKVTDWLFMVKAKVNVFKDFFSPGCQFGYNVV